MTDAEVDYFYQYLPLIEARAHYGVAQLNADFREMFFPRYLDPDPNESKVPPRRRQVWTPEELLPPFAWFDRPEPMPLEAAEALAAHFVALPAWAQKIAPISEARLVLA